MTGEAGDAELPAADATVSAEDDSFTSEGLVAGANRIRFDNTGDLEGGDSQITERNLTSGTYALICFISNRAGARLTPHWA